MINKLLLVSLMFLSVSAPGFTSKGIYTPQFGSVERKQIINTLKADFKAELKKPVRIRVTAFKIQHDWSFVRGVILDKSGGPMDYKGTPYQGAVEAGMFDDWFCSLLHKEKGKWRIVTHAIGATDMPYLDWADIHNAPGGIFK